MRLAVARVLRHELAASSEDRFYRELVTVEIPSFCLVSSLAWAVTGVVRFVSLDQLDVPRSDADMRRGLGMLNDASPDRLALMR